MPQVDEYPTYKVGDLVRLYGGKSARFYWDWSDYDDMEESYGVVMGRTESWVEAYNEAKNSGDEGTRYWDNVNYAPYKVLTIERTVEWVGPEHMELIG